MKLFYRFLAISFSLLIACPHFVCAQCGNLSSTKVTSCPCEKCKDAIARAGDPFNPYTGNEHRAIRDLEVWGGVGQVPLVWTRYYNSREFKGWTYSFEYWLVDDGLNSNGQAQLTVWFPEGGGASFTQSTSDPSNWLPDVAVQSRLSQNGINYTWQTSDGFRYRFEKLTDATGRSYYQLTDFKDSYQNLYKLEYNIYHELTRITEPAGRFLEMTYGEVDGSGPLVKVMSSDGRSVSYNYDVYNDGASSWVRLISVDYGDGTQASYTYIQPMPYGFIFLEHAIDPRYAGTDVNMRFTYDHNIAKGYIKEERNGKTGEIMATLNADSLNRWVCYANGRVQHYVMPNSLQGRTKEYTDGLGRTQKFSFNEITGYVQTMTDALGRTTTFSKSSYDNPLETTYPDGSKESWTRDDLDLILTHADELGRVTTYTRDNRHLVTKIEYPDRSTESFTYNDFAQVVTHTRQNGGVETTTYDNRGLKTAFTDALGNTTIYGYDNADRLAFVTDARGNTTRSEYNERGLLTKLTNADNSFQSYAYDDFGNRTSITNELGNTWTRIFDEFKRLESSKDPLNRLTKYDYDLPRGLCGCQHDNNTPTQIISPSGKITKMEYDVEWELVHRTEGFGSLDAATTSFEFDLVGNLVNTIDPKGNRWLAEYDVRNRKIATTDPLGHQTKQTFDSVGNILSVTRPDSGVTSNLYDARNRITETTDALGHVTKMKYDEEGSLLILTDAKGNSYNYEYDLENRKTKMVYPDASFEGFTYDEVGNLASFTNRSGAVLTNTYDIRNRQTLSNWDDENTPDVSRTYDIANRLITLSSTVSELSYAYDNANELLSETQNVAGLPGKTVNYTYDQDRLRKTLTYPMGDVLTYDYTARNQVASISSNVLTGLVDYKYDLNGSRITKNLNNSTTTDYVYDPANRLLTVDNKNASGSFARFDYGYDNVNRRTFVKRDGDKGDVYGYDETDQITSVQYNVANPGSTPASPLRAVNYNWDPTGNRTTVVDNDSTTTYSVNNLNQYTDINSNPLTYNNNGALRTIDGWTYSYDAQDRLIGAQKENIVVSFFYDPRNRRVRQIANGENIFLYYEEWNFIEERDQSDSLLQRYMYGTQIDEVFSKSFPTKQTVYYNQDALGNTVGLTDAIGDVVEQYTYDVFGTVTITNREKQELSKSSFGNYFLFTGRQFIPEIQLYDYRRRTYSSSLGKFLQPDPIRFNARDYNLYRYVENNPVNITDPLGLEEGGGESVTPEPSPVVTVVTTVTPLGETAEALELVPLASLLKMELEAKKAYEDCIMAELQGRQCPDCNELYRKWMRIQAARVKAQSK